MPSKYWTDIIINELQMWTSLCWTEIYQDVQKMLTCRGLSNLHISQLLLGYWIHHYTGSRIQESVITIWSQFLIMLQNLKPKVKNNYQPDRESWILHVQKAIDFLSNKYSEELKSRQKQIKNQPEFAILSWQHQMEL